MSYEGFASYYDELMDPAFYDDYMAFIIKNAPEARRVLELGCGTGIIACGLAGEGLDVTATDLSADMLDVAQERAAGEGLHLHFACVDMTDYEPTHDYDLVLCLCDSLNYLLDKQQLIRALMLMSESLNERGTLIFDVNSLYKHNVMLDDYHESTEDEDGTFRWDVFSDHKGYVRHHVLIHDNTLGVDVDEIHEQQSYTLETYTEILDTLNLRYDIYSDFEKRHDDCERYQFVCRRKEAPL